MLSIKTVGYRYRIFFHDYLPIWKNHYLFCVIILQKGLGTNTMKVIIDLDLFVYRILSFIIVQCTFRDLLFIDIDSKKYI